jgi:predicted transcriptional regulator
MDDSTGVDLRLVVRIVAGYLRHNRIAVDQMDGLIAGVQRSLAEVGRQASPPPEEAVRVPAVPVRRSVQRDYIVCLECGFRGLVLRRHLATRHGLDPDGYRARWKLPAAYPLVAPSYSERRSQLAHQIGLGQQAMAASDGNIPASENDSTIGAAGPDPALAAAPSAPPQPRRRGRPRRSQLPA